MGELVVCESATGSLVHAIYGATGLVVCNDAINPVNERVVDTDDIDRDEFCTKCGNSNYVINRMREV